MNERKAGQSRPRFERVLDRAWARLRSIPNISAPLTRMPATSAMPSRFASSRGSFGDDSRPELNPIGEPEICRGRGRQLQPDQPKCRSARSPQGREYSRRQGRCRILEQCGLSPADGTLLAARQPDLWIGHVADALWASYDGKSPAELTRNIVMAERHIFSTGTPWEPVVGIPGPCVGPFCLRLRHHSTDANGQMSARAMPILRRGRRWRISQRALATAGVRLKHVCTRMFVVNIERDWQQIGKAHGEFFHAIRPVTAWWKCLA